MTDSAPLSACALSLRSLPLQAPWTSKCRPDVTDWDALLAEVLTQGRDVPEVTWVKPGEDAANEVRERGAFTRAHVNC